MKPQLLTHITILMLGLYAHADPLLEVQSGTFGSGIPNTYNSPFLTSPTGPLSTSSDAGLVSGRGIANYGTFYVESHGHGYSGNPNGNGNIYGRGQAALSDIVTIDGPLLTGQQGAVTFRVSTLGHMVFEGGVLVGPSDASFGYALGVSPNDGTPPNFFTNTWGIGGTGGYSYYGGGTVTPGVTQEFSHTLVFTFGTAFELNLLVTSTSVARQGDSDTTTNDFTLNWGGIDGVTGPGGVSVPIYTATAESGFNYAAAVPEPSAAILLFLGAALGICRRPLRQSAPNA